MKPTLRFSRLLAGIAAEIGSLTFIGYVLLNVSAVAVPLAVAVGLGQLVNAMLAGDRSAIIAGLSLIAVAMMLSVLSPVGYRWTTIRMRERSDMVVRRRILDLSLAIPRSTQLERPEFWDRARILQQGGHDLAMGAASAVIAVLVALQLVAASWLFGRLELWLAVAPLVALPAGLLASRSSRASAEMEARQAENRRVADRLFAIATDPGTASEAGLHGLSDELVRRHRAILDSAARELDRLRLRSIGRGLLAWMLFAVVYFGAAVVVLRLHARGGADPGDVALSLGLATGVVFASGRLADLVATLISARTMFGHYAWLEDQSKAGGTVFEPPPVRLVDGLKLKNLGFRYEGTDSWTLKDVSIDLPAGAVVAIVGESGAGKSTLAKILCGLYSPTAGHLLVDGVSQDLVEVDQYRTRITTCFQDFARFEFLLGDSVGVGELKRLKDTDAIQDALAAADAGFVDGLPAGTGTQLGTAWAGGVDLSGGEWQKLAVARALMRRSPLLAVLDEPSAALDPESEHRLFEQVAASARAGRSDGRITVLISHRFSTVQMADLILVLDKGRLIDHGTHQHLVGRQGLYADLYQLQSAAYR